MEINRQLIVSRETSERNRWYILNRVLHHEMVHLVDGVVHGYGLWETEKEGKRYRSSRSRTVLREQCRRAVLALQRRMRLARWSLASVVLGVFGVAAYLGSVSSQQYSHPEEELQKAWSPATSGEVAQGVASPPPVTADPGTDPKPSADWEEAKRDCPWPPRVDTWRALDSRCVATMERLRPADWVFALHDPLATRQTVIAAFDKPECLEPLEQTRAGLYEACSAESIVRLAVLQNNCVDALRPDWNERLDANLDMKLRLDPGTAQITLGSYPPYSQEEYYRLVESHNRFVAEALWRTHLCDSVPAGALDWIDALPIPPDHQTQGLFADLPTQAPDLVEAARRLGASIPDSALPPFEIRGSRPRYRGGD